MKEIRALTGIRGVAALTVFLAHAQDTLAGRGLILSVPTPLSRLFLSSGRQVDIFFVLSGFILALTYGSWFQSSLRWEACLTFLRRRFARIYPLHFFVLVLVLVFATAAQLLHAPVLNGTARFNLSTLPATVLLVHAWGFAGWDGGPWNPPSWSISIEWLAYLLFPIFLWGTYSMRKRHPWLIIAALACCGFALNLMTFWGLAGFPGIARGMSEFAFGCVLADVCYSSIGNWLRTNPGSAVAFAALAVCFALTPDTGFVIALFTAPVLVALSGGNWLSRLYGCAPIYFLGEISYSIYMGHFLYSSICYRIVSVEWMRSGMLATCAGLLFIVGFVVGLSTLTYYGIERPARDWLSGKRRGPAADTAPAERTGR